MSSRFDYDGDEGAMPIALWQANVRRALTGKRGQEALRELESALLALPTKRLISGELCDRSDVCVVGAIGLHRLMRTGLTLDQALAGLPHDIDNDYETAWYGERELKLTETLAWHLGWVNDEELFGLTPEQRYGEMLSWVRDQLAPA